jgi:hypothetical protein
MLHEPMIYLVVLHQCTVSDVLQQHIHGHLAAWYGVPGCVAVWWACVAMVPAPSWLLAVFHTDVTIAGRLLNILSGVSSIQ